MMPERGNGRGEMVYMCSFFSELGAIMSASLKHMPIALMGGCIFKNEKEIAKSLFIKIALGIRLS